MKNNSNINHLGFIVSKKVSKSSVKRNRIRRLIKEVYRLNETNVIKGINILVGWKSDCSFELANFNDIEKCLLLCFKKANIIVSKKIEEDENV